MSKQTKSTVELYFIQDPDNSSKWKCKCGKVLVQRKNAGWTNLLNHIKSQHPEHNQIVKPHPKLDNFVTVGDNTKKGRNIYGWLNWICCDLKPFNFVENEYTRLYTNLDPISENTLKKYVGAVTKSVEKIISDLLPSKFSIIIDGWTKKSTHFIGIFAAYSSATPNGYETVLLAFSPMLVETGFSANAHIDLIEFVLEVYGKSLDNVVSICADNAEVNKAVASRCNLPLVGCSSHRFNLAIMDFLKPHDKLLNKVNILMGKLKTL